MKRRARIRFVITLLTLGLLLGPLAGCALVKPWERDALARQDMAWESDPMRSTLAGHIRFSKEGSLPAGSAGGGGCGCN